MDDVSDGGDDDGNDGDDGDDGDDVGGDDDGDDEVKRQPPRGRRARDAAPTAQEINNPDLASSKEAKDIKYFFLKTETGGRVCVECL